MLVEYGTGSLSLGSDGTLGVAPRKRILVGSKYPLVSLRH